MILADGARPDVMVDMAKAGELPVLKRHFLDPGGFRSASSVFPTVSGPAHLPVLTGAHPGRANLPGIRWAERPGALGFFGRTRSYMAPFRQSKLARDVDRNVTTLFQHVDGLADVNTWFVRGCLARARRTRFSKAAAFARSYVSKDWYASDLQAEHAVIRSFEAGFPSVFSVFPAIDELGHRCGPLVEESFESYRRFDAALGRVLDAQVREGTLDRTLVMITSDHGQSATHTHFELDAFVARVIPQTLSYPKLWRHMFSAKAAVMVSGNSMANIYLAGRSGWKEPPDLEDRDGRPAELMARLLAEPAIDHVIYRRSETCYVVANPRGKAIIGYPPDRAFEVEYHIEGDDPFGYPSLPTRMTRDDVARLTSASAYPDAPWQVAQFFRSPRAGDLVVCAREGYDLRANFEYQPHKGSHGCLGRAHMMVPAAINARWAPGDGLRSVDLFPTLLHAIGKPVPGADVIDGETRTILRP